MSFEYVGVSDVKNRKFHFIVECKDVIKPGSTDLTIKRVIADAFKFIKEFSEKQNVHINITNFTKNGRRN